MKSVERILVLVAAVSAMSLGLAEEKRPLRDGSEKMTYLDNGIIKVGVDLARGGSIGYLADAKEGVNVVNAHDLGRWIGQSYYAGPRPFGTPHPDWKDWPWNPVMPATFTATRRRSWRRRTTARRFTSSPSRCSGP